MGNNESQPSNIQILRKQNWIEADEDSQKVLFFNVNPYRKRLLANIINNDLIQQYELNFIAQQDYNNYVKQLTFRQSSWRPDSQKTNLYNKFIYPIKYFVNSSKQQMCTTIYTGYLYIDKVDLRLKEINDIPFTDLLYMYKSTLQGFKVLYQKVGYFDIQQEMIFITRRGQIKVWMNANLSKNYPNFEKSDTVTNKSQKNSQSIYGSQAQMIKDLIELIQSNSDENQQILPPLFSIYLAERNLLDRLSFDYCLEKFDNYLHQYNLYCTNFMKSIPELFSPYSSLPTVRLNYQQSRVNEITSNDLRLMKKHFAPMQPIAQDQNFTNEGTIYKKDSQQNNNQKVFHQSKVSPYTPAKLIASSSRSDHFTHNIAPQQPYYQNLSKSRQSYISNQNVPQLQNQKSFVNSNNISIVHNNLIPPRNLSNQHTHSSKQFIPIQQYPIIQHPVYIHPNINPPSNLITQTIVSRNSSQNIISSNVPQFKFNPPVQFHPMQKAYIASTVFHPITNIADSSIQIRKPIQNQNQNIQIRQSNTLIPNINNKFNDFSQKQMINPFEHISNQKSLTKSNIKYYSTNQQYSLDEEIANDLEKFLGLKVN